MTKPINIFVLGLLATTLPFTSIGQEVLPGVTVTGIAPVPVYVVYVDSPFMDAGEFNNPYQYVQHNNMVNAAHALSDVRCVASGDRRQTTSMNDLTDRYLATTDVFQKMQGASGVLQGMLIGQAINPLTGITVKAFSVTYADGGTEKWMIQPSPFFSLRVVDDPLQSSLKKGDGVPKPSPTGCK